MDQKLVFSNGERVADYLRDAGLDGNPLVGEPDFLLTTVIGYLSKGHAYYPRSQRYGSFIQWDTRRARDVVVADAVHAACRIAAQSGEDTVLAMGRPLPARFRGACGLRALKSFTGSEVVPNWPENYFLYLVPAEAARRAGAASGSLRSGASPSDEQKPTKSDQ